MVAKVLCKLDPLCGPGLLVQEGQLRAITTLPQTSIVSSIHGDLAAASGTYYFEFYVWSTSRASIANLVSIGIAQPHADVTKYTGQESISYGWRLGNGDVFNNGAAIASGLAVQSERAIYGLYLFLSPGVATLTLCVNSTGIQTISLPLGKTWIPSISIASAIAGDMQAAFNFGQNLFEAPLDPTGWQQLSPGLATLTIAASEGFMSAHTDPLPDTYFAGDVLNPFGFSVKRAPLHWAHRTQATQTGPIPSAFAPLLLNNSTGKYNALVAADARGSVVAIDSLDAPPMGFGTTTAATRMLTASIDRALQPDPSTVQVNLKDSIARNDRPMPVHVIPLWYDSPAAGKMKPFGLGIQRNFNPVLIDGATNTYLLGDLPFTNVPLVMSNAAPMDPLVPQYVGALGGTAIQLLVAPVGKISCDGSTFGDQYQAGVSDVLNGVGAFTTWTSGVPNGWALPTTPAAVVANGSIAQTSAYGTTSAIMITSRVPYTPGISVGYAYGYPVGTTTVPLLAGRTYRFSFQVLAVIGQYPETFGFAILTGLADDPRYWVTDYRAPIRQPLGGVQRGTYVYEYTVPVALGNLPVYLSVISQFGGTAPSAATCIVVVDNLKVELLGQFTRATMFSPPLDAAIAQILVSHAGESSAIFSQSDAQALQAASATAAYPGGYKWGLRYTEIPNVCDVVQELLDVFGGVMFTDQFDIWRFRRLIDPDTATALAVIDETNVDPKAPFQIVADEALALTTIFGARPNCDPNGDNDFVTDTGIVGPAEKAALSEPAQFTIDADVQPAAEYIGANGAPMFVTRHDEDVLCRIEGNRVCSIWGAARYIAGQLQSGKRRIVTVTVDYRGLAFGSSAGSTVAPQGIGYGDVFAINLPDVGLVNKNGAVLAWEHFPFAKKVTLDLLI